MTEGTPQIEIMKPNFFIVGAPKSGTTSLYRYLQSHPEVFMPEQKESHFFMTDPFGYGRPRTDGEYLRLFSLGIGKKRIGEASTHYLYSTEATAKIKAFAPEARILIMLRNPVDMIYSLHAQRVWNGREDILDFEAAIDADPEREWGLRLPRYPYPVEVQSYLAMGKYCRHVMRYQQSFDKVHVLIFDDFIRDTLGCYQDVCRFLEISDAHRPPFVIHNERKLPRSAALRRFIRYSSWIKAVAKVTMPKASRRMGRQVLDRLNVRREPGRPIHPELRRRLEKEFAPDVIELERVLGRSLTVWADSKDLQVGTAESLDIIPSGERSDA